MQRRCLSLRGPALLCPPLFFSPTLLLLCSDLSLVFSALVILLNVPVIAATVLSCHQGRNLSSASLALCLIPCSGNYLFPCHHSRHFPRLPSLFLSRFPSTRKPSRLSPFLNPSPSHGLVICVALTPGLNIHSTSSLPAMAEPTGSGAHGVSNHVAPSVPSGRFDGVTDKPELQHPSQEEKTGPDDDEEEDMDALIEELESQDGHIDAEDEGPEEPGGARPVPEELLQTDTRTGLTDSEVLARRKKFGLNQMKEEKENLVLKFFSYFIGPIQFVMEVS